MLGVLPYLAVLAMLMPSNQLRESSSIAATVHQVLAGQVRPVTMKLKDLKGKWQEVTVNDNKTIYTKGDTVRIGSETFLIGYNWKPTAKEARELRFPKLTPESTLSLMLINMKSISSLTGIRPFNMSETLDEFNYYIEMRQR